MTTLTPNTVLNKRMRGPPHQGILISRGREKKDRIKKRSIKKTNKEGKKLRHKDKWEMGEERKRQGWSVP